MQVTKFFLYFVTLLPSVVFGASGDAFSKLKPLVSCLESISALPGLLSIGDNYVGEEVGKSQEFGKTTIVYFRGIESRDENRVQVVDGRLLDSNGILISTNRINDPMRKDIKGALGVLSKDGILYITEKFKLDRDNYLFRHSSLVAGEPVYWAGGLEVIEGKVQFISRNSGHYLPSLSHLYFFVRALKAAGVDLSEAKVETKVNSSSQILVDALDFIEKK